MSAFGPALLSSVGRLPFNPVASLVVFLTTFAIYSVDKVSGSKEDLLNIPERAALAKYPIKQLSALSYMAAILLVALTDFWKLPSVLFIGLAGIIYTVRIRGTRPKDITCVKNLIVASSIAICYADQIEGPIQLYVLAFLVIFVDTVLFDLRDIIGDSAMGVRTLPVVFGRGPILVLLFVIDIIIYTLSPSISIYGAFLIIYFRKERSSLHYDLLIDAWMMWVLVLLYFLGYSHVTIF